jgi:hypothetical protein
MTDDNPILFTPRLSATDPARRRMHISREDHLRFSMLPQASRKQVTITDVFARRRFKVRRAPCGLGCRCDAVIVQEIQL